MFSSFACNVWVEIGTDIEKLATAAVIFQEMKKLVQSMLR